MRRPEGVTVIAVYHFIISLPLLVGACAMIGVPLSGALQGADDTGRFWAMFGLGLGSLTLLGFALVGIVAGWGLLRLKSWARWLAVILSVLSLPLFPIGTLLGAVMIWYLLQGRVRLAFEAGGAAGAPPVASATAEASAVEEPEPEDGARAAGAEEVEDPPYVIPPELDPEGAAETLLDAEEAAETEKVVEAGTEAEEVVGAAEATLISGEDVAAQTLIAEEEAAAAEAEAEQEAAEAETIILSAEELAEAQEDGEGSDEEDKEDKESEG